MTRKKTTGAAFVATLALASASAIAQQYQLTDIGTLGGSTSYAYGVNDNVQVVGAADDGTGWPRAFLYSNGQMSKIETDYPSSSSVSSGALGISQNGQVTGWTQVPVGIYLFQVGFRYDSATNSATTFGPLGGFEAAGYAINDRGQVAGVTSNGTGPSSSPRVAFLFSQGPLRALSTAVHSYANGINVRGEIAGTEANVPQASMAVIFNSRLGTTRKLGYLGGIASAAQDINDYGQVAGTIAVTPTVEHAILYSNGAVQDLGTLGGVSSESLAINNSGHVTGFFKPNDFTRRAFLYDGTIMRDLNSLIDPTNPLAPYVTLTDANDISGSGVIVANGVDSRTGKTHGYLLSPSPPVVTPTIVGSPGSNGWYVGDVSVSWNAIDNESPVISAPCPVTTLSADTAGTTVSCSATSSGGTTTASVTVKIDKTTPTCTATLHPGILRPITHQLNNISAYVSPGVVGPSGAGGVSLYSVVSSEADRGLGRDDIPGDIVGWSAAGGQLRAEAYSIAGRTYTARFRMTSTAGRSGLCSATVVVPQR